MQPKPYDEARSAAWWGVVCFASIVITIDTLAAWPLLGELLASVRGVLS